MDDKKYWSEYYSNNQKPTDASSFAVFVQEKLEKGKTLIELGCGNGRDSVYFAGHGVNVIAVDQVDDEIDYLNENYAGDNLCFVCDDFTNLVETADDRIKGNSFDYIYSRFTFHSINEGKEDRTLDWISEHLDGLFFLEARSLKDPMFKKGRALSGTGSWLSWSPGVLRFFTVLRIMTWRFIRMTIPMSLGLSPGNDCQLFQN